MLFAVIVSVVMLACLQLDDDLVRRHLYQPALALYISERGEFDDKLVDAGSNYTHTALRREGCIQSISAQLEVEEVQRPFACDDAPGRLRQSAVPAFNLPWAQCKP